MKAQCDSLGREARDGFAFAQDLVVVVGFVIPKIIAALPAPFINLPNKRFWLAPEHLAETVAFLNGYFAWFGCALFQVSGLNRL